MGKRQDAYFKMRLEELNAEIKALEEWQDINSPYNEKWDEYITKLNHLYTKRSDLKFTCTPVNVAVAAKQYPFNEKILPFNER